MRFRAYLFAVACLGGLTTGCSPPSSSQGWPKLTVNNDAAACPAFLEAVKASYRSADVRVSAALQPWPATDFEWVFSPKDINADIEARYDAAIKEGKDA